MLMMMINIYLTLFTRTTRDTAQRSIYSPRERVGFGGEFWGRCRNSGKDTRGGVLWNVFCVHLKLFQHYQHHPPTSLASFSPFVGAYNTRPSIALLPAQPTSRVKELFGMEIQSENVRPSGDGGRAARAADKNSNQISSLSGAHTLHRGRILPLLLHLLQQQWAQ